MTTSELPAALGANNFANRLASYRALATKSGWTDEQFVLACDQAGDESSNEDDYFAKLCDFVEGAMPCSYWGHGK